MKFALITTILFIAHTSFSAVWETKPGAKWTDSWEAEYVSWIANDVEGDFFKKLGKPYSNIPLDCADAHYALRAYFAMTHGLPFAANGGAITRQTSKFDSISNSKKRMAKFIRFLRDNYWTETLAFNDTFPPALDDLLPGDLFMYKVSSGGKFTRHTYIVKNINPDGTFDILYSTQANALAGGPLFRKTSYMFKKAPKNSGKDSGHWGFRRMKRPQHISLDQEAVPGFSNAQYSLAKSMSSHKFFSLVKKTNQTISESPNMITQRNFSNICTAVKDRVDTVAKAVKYQKAISGKCMNFSEYDTHSTPSRDSGLMDDYRTYEFDYQTIIDDGEEGKVSKNLRDLTELIFSWPLSSGEQEFVLESCPVEFGKSSSGKKLLTDLATFRAALFGGTVSYHPNDNLYRRWGVSKGSKTTCTEYYGYPE